MSTKCTITHGDNFHMFYECLDDDNVYLEIDNADYVEISKYNNVTHSVMSIPLTVWNKLVEHGKLKSWSGETPENPRTQEERNKDFEEGLLDTIGFLNSINKESKKE